MLVEIIKSRNVVLPFWPVGRRRNVFLGSLPKEVRGACLMTDVTAARDEGDMIDRQVHGVCQRPQDPNRLVELAGTCILSEVACNDDQVRPKLLPGSQVLKI